MVRKKENEKKSIIVSRLGNKALKIDGREELIRLKIEALPKKQRDGSYIVTEISDVAENLSISQEEVNTLLELGELETPSIETIGEAGSNYITKDSFSRLLKTMMPKSALENIIYDNNPEFKKRLNLDQLEEEIGRYNPEYINGLNLIVIRKKKEGILKKKIMPARYSKKQVKQRLREIGEETLKQLRWGSEILQESLKGAEKIYENGKIAKKRLSEIPYGEKSLRVRETLRYFRLEYTKRNLNRFIGYYEKGEFNFEDKGIIPKILSRHTFKDENEKNEMGKYLRDLYRRFFSKNEKENEDISMVKEREDINLFSGVINLRATIYGIEDFKKRTITPLQLSTMTFNIDLNDYFLKKGDDFDIGESIKQEAALYSDKKLDLLEPIMVDGQRRYHHSDSDDFNAVLKEKALFNNIELGIRMKLGIEAYKLDERRNDKGLTIQQVADELGTTADIAKELITFVDVGILNEMGKKTARGYDQIEEFYKKYFKDKVEGFTDEAVRDWRVDRSTLDKFITQNLQEAPFSLEEADQELMRQYEIDDKKGILFSDVLKPFNVSGKSLYTKDQIAKIRKLMENDKLRKRIEWGNKLKKFYSQPKVFSDYVKVDELQKMLGLSDTDWQRLKPRLATENPAIKEIEKEEGKLKDKKNGFSPAKFDKKYFKEEFREYITKKYVDNFKNKFYQPKTVAHALTGIEGSIDSLLEESKELGIPLTELKPYNLNSENKEGEFYLNDEITELKEGLKKGGKLRRLTIALGISAKIDEARDKGTSDYESLEEAAEKLGISIQNLKKYTKKYGPLTTGDIGITPVLTKLINNSYNTRFTETDISQFCKKDTRYSDIRKIEGVLNIDKFIENTMTIEEAEKEVSGEGWLAEKVFEHCLNKVEPIYLKINDETKIHSSDVDATKTYQTQQMRVNFIEREIGYKLTGIREVIPRQYALTVTGRDKESIAKLTAAVAQFKEECYDISQVEKEVGVSFPENISLNNLLEQTAPRNIAFINSLYHMSDVKKLKAAVENSAKKLKVTKERIIQFSKNTYIRLCEKGISEEEVTRLVRNSHSAQNIADISNALSQVADINNYNFSYNNTIFFPGESIAEYVRKHPVNDISSKGIIMLARKIKDWEEYMTQELNGNNSGQREKIESIIIKYMMNDLNITNKNNANNAYNGVDFTTLNAFQRLLQKHNVHNISKFKKEWKRGRFTVDPENSYYTRGEVTKIVGVNENILDKISDDISVSYLGDKLLQEDEKYNKAGLYSLRDVARIALKLGDDEVKKLNDPLEAVLIHKLKLKNKQAFNALNLVLAEDGSIFSCNEMAMNALGDFFKIGGKYDNTRDSLCYQKIDNAYRRLRAT